MLGVVRLDQGARDSAHHLGRFALARWGDRRAPQSSKPQDHWSRGGPVFSFLFQRLGLLDKAARLEAFVAPDFQQHEKSLKDTKVRTGRGLDDTGPIFYEQLPMAAREAWHQLSADCFRKAAWPWLLLANLIVLLGFQGHCATKRPGEVHHLLGETCGAEVGRQSRATL